MKKFKIYYNSGTFTCFTKVEEFEDYETAVLIVKTNNKYGVMYPDIIQISPM